MAVDGAKTIGALSIFAPQLEKELYARVDLPSTTLRDPNTQEPFIACEVRSCGGFRYEENEQGKAWVAAR